MSTIDLDKPPTGHEYKVTVEPQESIAERNVRLAKDVALFVTALAFVAIIAWLCVETLHSTSSSDEEKKWAMSILSGGAGAIVGYLLKK